MVLKWMIVFSNLCNIFLFYYVVADYLRFYEVIFLFVIYFVLLYFFCMVSKMKNVIYYTAYVIKTNCINKS